MERGRDGREEERGGEKGGMEEMVGLRRKGGEKTGMENDVPARYSSIKVQAGAGSQSEA